MTFLPKNTPTNRDLIQHIKDPNAHTNTGGGGGGGDLQEHIDDSGDPHAAAGYVKEAELDAHVNDFQNPHQTTAEQVGAEPAGSVAAHIADTTAHVASNIVNDSSVAGANVKNALTNTQTTVVDHINNQANPHNTTATLTPFDDTTAGLGATTVQGAIEAVDSSLDTINTVFTDVHEPTGMLNTNLDSTLAVVNGTRTFSITPTGPSFDVYVSGAKFNIASQQSVVWEDVEGNHFFVFDNTGTLIARKLADFPDQDALVEFIIRENAFVAEIYWDATNQVALLFDERHGAVMDGETHKYLHLTRGAQYISGMTPGDLNVNQNGNDDEDAQFSLTAGVMTDEDIYSDIAAKGETSNLTILYKSGATGTWRWTTDSAPLITTGTGRAAWNENVGGTWQLTEIANNDFVLAHVFAVPLLNSAATGFVAIVGQADYTTLGAARTGAATEITNLVFQGLAFPEFVPVATFIYQTRNTSNNTWKSRLRTTDTGDDYIDWRQTPPVSSAGSASDHGSLAGLADDDHPQYATLANRTGETLDIDNLRAQVSAILGTSPPSGSATLKVDDISGVAIRTNGAIVVEDDAQPSNGTTNIFENSLAISDNRNVAGTVNFTMQSGTTSGDEFRISRIGAGDVTIDNGTTGGDLTISTLFTSSDINLVTGSTIQVTGGDLDLNGNDIIDGGTGTFAGVLTSETGLVADVPLGNASLVLDAGSSGTDICFVDLKRNGTLSSNIAVNTANVLEFNSAVSSDTAIGAGGGDLLVGALTISGTEKLRVSGGIGVSDDINLNGNDITDFANLAPTTVPSITGSRGGNAALASLLTALAGLGLITDNTTA